MNPTLKNILAIVIGAFAGGLVNMGIIMMSSSVIPPPNGVDVTTVESLKANIHLFEPRHFIMPFLAHAIGAFVGAYLAATIAETKKMRFAISIGLLFLIGGLTNAFILPAPAWFIALDLILAYIPTAMLGGRLAMKRVVA